MQVFALTRVGVPKVGDCHSATAEQMASGTWSIQPPRNDASGLPADIVRAANPPVKYKFGAIVKEREGETHNKGFAYILYNTAQIAIAMQLEPFYDVEVIVLLDVESPHPRWLPGWKPVDGVNFVWGE
jgi:hypothetical protein